MDQEEWQEQIERYLSEGMEPVERTTFEAKMQEDQALAQRVALAREVNAALEDTQGLALENDLETIGNEFAERYTASDTTKVKSLRVNRRKWLLAAASVLVLLSFWFVFRSFSKNTTAQLYAESYEPYITTSTTRSTNTRLKTTFDEALASYQKGTYAEALLAFEELTQRENLSEDDRMLFQFYQGLSQMALGEIEKAIPSFRILIQQHQNLYVQQSKWYLSLCYLKQGKTTEAQSLLQEITQEATRGKYFHAAQELLKKI